MAEPFYRVGELRGPFPVVSVEFELLGNGRYREMVRDSMGNGSETIGLDDDREYHLIVEREPYDSILVPYTKKHPLTEEGLVSQDPTWVDVSGSPYDYWRVLCDWWNGDLTVIEHDVKASPEIFKSFESCPEPWCYYTYDNFLEEDALAWHWGILGCTRFRSSIITEVPDAVTSIEWRYRDWHHVSTGLGKALREAGFEPHVHGVVDHHRMMDVGGIANMVAA
jgi:hypothetical protein